MKKKKEILLKEGHPIQHSSAAQQYSGPPSFHGRLSSQSQSTVAATEYYINHPAYGPGSYSNFQEILFTLHFLSGNEGE